MCQLCVLLHPWGVFVCFQLYFVLMMEFWCFNSRVPDILDPSAKEEPSSNFEIGGGFHDGIVDSVFNHVVAPTTINSWVCSLGYQITFVKVYI